MTEESSLLVQTLEQIPSPEEFSSLIEPRNVPVVVRACTKDWKAFDKWNPSNGGLKFLQDKVGSSAVEAMLTRSAPVFYGHIRGHERVEIPFSCFLESCRQHMQHEDDSDRLIEESEQSLCADSISKCSDSPAAEEPQQIYLAQVPIYNRESQEKVQLPVLREDIKIPSFLQTKKLSSINLWMNNTSSRSSTHYDPHQNLLCIVHGCKQVILWPPSASPYLYLMPIYGEASNHSSVPLENPDIATHPLFKSAANYSQKVTLQEGDALLIPEGWFHQVDSEELTIAVNFWWKSDVMAGMPEHMDAYYFRRLLRRLIDKEMNNMLHQGSAGRCDVRRIDSVKDGYEDNTGLNIGVHQNVKLEDLAPQAVLALHRLVALVHDRVSVTTDQPEFPCSSDSLVVTQDESCKKFDIGDLCNLDDDPVAKIIWHLQADTLQSVLLAMVHIFPRTLEALILHMLSPVGAEVLTQRFDEMDKIMAEEDRGKFYEFFYSVFDDSNSAAEVILKGKEIFARQAFKKVMDSHVSTWM